MDAMTEDKHRRTALDVAAAIGKHEILALFKREGKVLPGSLLHHDSDEDW